MDRINIGNAKVAGTEDDLNLTDNQYSVAIPVFQVAYVIFGVPSNMILPRVRPSLYIPLIMMLWGSVVACMAAIQSPGQLHALRFLLGITETRYSPSVLSMLSMWYRRNE
jgi:MFS family permease